MSAAFSGPLTPWPPKVPRVEVLATPVTLQAAVRLVLQPEARIALAIVVRSAGLRNGLSRRVRSRTSNWPKVPWMNDGPALLPTESTRDHLASTNGSNASL